MTWEERMSARAQARESERVRRESDARWAAMQAELASVDPDKKMTLAGTCDVCGGEIRGVFPLPWRGDFTVAEDGAFVTWLRHIHGPLPDCDRYFSAVREVVAAK